MPPPFVQTEDFHALNLRDLLEAREAYHVHLSHLDNVLATAVGLYRIRTSEIKKDGKEAAAKIKPTPTNAPVRTLANSQVVLGSWPCVMVFVRDWRPLDDFSETPEQVIPHRLYLPDGRMIPVCVILAERADEVLKPTVIRSYPANFAGGGYPALTVLQGRSRLGSIGCLVSDGREVFALTNRHVAGNPGDTAETIVGRRRVGIGTSVPARVGKIPFTKAFPGWPGARSLCNLDAGLIRLDGLSGWTAQVFGVGELGEPVDLNTETLSLALIGAPVRAFGAASGRMEGEVQALFYRYKAIGGFDYIADLLIGPRKGGPVMPTGHGDSGTLWVYDPPPKKPVLEDERQEPRSGLATKRYLPLALQWGGHTFLGQKGEMGIRYVLASCVSTVCRVLDVELVRDLHIGLPETWGETGHFTIGAKALELPENQSLRDLLELNKDNIGRSDAAIGEGHLGAHPGEFVPLADVADLVWRNTRRADANNHFADMDRVATSGRFAGESLMSLFKRDPNSVDPEIWLEFYADLPKISPETGKPENPGALPFRVWQMYDVMVQSLKDEDVTRFVAAGGLMSHYVGDACQPLHVSRLHHGNDPSQDGVHADYETRMLDNPGVQLELLTSIDKALASKLGKVKRNVDGGKKAAVSVVGLMAETIAKLPPEDVIASWDAHRGRGRFQAMWKDLGKRTIARMAAGCTCMAALWQSAWEEGDGDRLGSGSIREIPKKDLMALYTDASFVPSMSLQKMFHTGILGSPSPNGSGSSDGDAHDGQSHAPRRDGRRRRKGHV